MAPTRQLIGLELLPDWAPFGRRTHARFRTLVKVAMRYQVVEVSAIRVQLLGDGHVPIVTVPSGTAEAEPVAGPAWRIVPSRLVAVDKAVMSAQAVLDDVRSKPVDRRACDRTLTLTAIRDVLAIAGEPHLWWRYFNQSGRPIRVLDLQQSRTLWIDGQPRWPDGAYNGPATVAPGFAISGLWSLDAFVPHRSGRHQVHVTMLDERSETVVVDL